jgi:hypothetical protein
VGVDKDDKDDEDNSEGDCSLVVVVAMDVRCLNCLVSHCETI